MAKEKAKKTKKSVTETFWKIYESIFSFSKKQTKKRKALKVVIFFFSIIIIIFGIVLLFTPGPGILFILIGIAILSAFSDNLRKYVKKTKNVLSKKEKKFRNKK